MSNKIKKFFKIVLIIVFIIFLGLIYFRYQELKEEGKIEKIFASSKKNVVYTNSTDPYENNKKEKSSSSDSTGNKIVLEKKNYDGYYNEFNFDNALLIYEGDQNEQMTKEALNRLIVNADGSLYTKPTIVFQNFSGLNNSEINAENLSEYKNVLNQAKKSLKSGTYNFSFEYNNLKSMVNKIIITKK